MENNRLKYRFSVKWFEKNIEKWSAVLKPLSKRKFNALEIGAFEGASTTWILDNLLNHSDSRLISVDTFQGSSEHKDDATSKDLLLNLEDNFLNNVKLSSNFHKLSVIKNFSHLTMLEMLPKFKEHFNFIYIDGSHTAKDVLADAVLAWELLSIGGIMIFDDYKWDYYKNEYDNPKIAIDSFLSCYKPNLELLHQGYQVIAKKIC